MPFNSFKFLDCAGTLTYSGCQPTPPEVQEKPNPFNLSAFDRNYNIIILIKS